MSLENLYVNIGAKRIKQCSAARQCTCTWRKNTNLEVSIGSGCGEGVQIVGSLNHCIPYLRTVTEQSTTNLQMLSWGLITFLLRNLSPHIMLMKSEWFVFIWSKAIDNGEGALLDFLHVTGEMIGEISKSSGCIFKCSYDKWTVHNNKIIRMHSTFLRFLRM